MTPLSLRDWLPGSGTESEFQKDKESKQATEEGCLDPSSFRPFVFSQIVLITQNAQASLLEGRLDIPPPTHTHTGLCLLILCSVSHEKILSLDPCRVGFIAGRRK